MVRDAVRVAVGAAVGVSLVIRRPVGAAVSELPLEKKKNGRHEWPPHDAKKTCDK